MLWNSSTLMWLCVYAALYVTAYSTGTLSAQLKSRLTASILKVPKNGIDCPDDKKHEIARLVQQIERVNPTKSPAYSALMNGNWRMLYTDFSPAAPSSGKLGPFIGDVFQDLKSGTLRKNTRLQVNRQDEGIIRNILKIGFPPIYGIYYILFLYIYGICTAVLSDFYYTSFSYIGELVAKQRVRDQNTWQIEFLYAANSILGLPLPRINFPQEEGKKEIRLWKITYLDDEFRILRARRENAPESDAFIFILRKSYE